MNKSPILASFDDLHDDFMFDYCISNPPYQKDINNRSAKIYPQFFLMAHGFALNILMIFPQAWIYGSGIGHISEAPVMQNMPSIKSIDVFTENKQSPVRLFDAGTGGVSVVYSESQYNNGNGIFYSVNGDKGSCVDKECVFTLSKNMTPLKSNMVKGIFRKGYNSMKERISGKTKFIYAKRLKTLIAEGKAQRTKHNDYCIKVVHKDNGDQEYWIKDDGTVKDHSGYKLTMPSTGTYRQHRDCFILKPGEVSTDAYIPVEFDTLKEAENFRAYLGSTFYSTLLSTGTASHNAARGAHRFVPDLGDYSDSNPDIDWSQPLDPQLYKIFNLNPEEIRAIEESDL